MQTSRRRHLRYANEQSTHHFWLCGIFFLVDFFIFFSDNSKCFHRNGFEMYILIIIYTLCTCDTLVPTRILNSEISWFCFDFPKWGPVSFIIKYFIKKFHDIRLSYYFNIINRGRLYFIYSN